MMRLRGKGNKGLAIGLSVSKRANNIGNRFMTRKIVAHWVRNEHQKRGKGAIAVCLEEEECANLTRSRT